MAATSQDSPGGSQGFVRRARGLARRLLFPSLMGRIDYLRSPGLGQNLGGPFNGQEYRRRIFQDILAAAPKVEVIVETGTYRGTTTEYMATVSGLPVFTVEADARAFGFAGARLGKLPAVSVARGDSRAFLKRLLEGNALAGRKPFFYLDAHWDQDLPLFEELDMIFTRCRDAVVMIDDFQVADDAGYIYDNYGQGKALDVTYIAPLVQRFGLARFFPAAPAAEESGLRRGCIVLARGDNAGIGSLEGLASLRRWFD